MKETLLIIDVYGLLFRAYYGIKPMIVNENLNINAVYGAIKTIFSIAQEVQHSYLLLALDGSGANKRHEIYPEYKANRIKCPEDLKPQFAILDSFLSTMQAGNIRYDGLEADDIINTYAKFAEKTGLNVVIATFDKDLMQLVSDKVSVYSVKTKSFIHSAQVFENFGVLPDQIADYLALIGDSSDNIPGVMGIGPKKAIELLAKYSNLDGIYNNISAISPSKTGDLLAAGRDSAYLSLSLTKLIYSEKLLEEFPINTCNKLNFAEISQNVVDLCKKYPSEALLKIFNIKNDADIKVVDSQGLFNFA